MELSYRLLHKSNNTQLQTSQPVYFYGLPDERIYIIYARFYEISFSKSGLEFVFAILEDYNYDFDSGKIMDANFIEINLLDFQNRLETSDFQIKIHKSYRNIKSFLEAQKKLNKKANKMTASMA